MKNKLTLTEQEELFVKDCKLINLKYEYNGYIGAERWAIITELSVKELWEKYPLVIERYSPFVHLSIAQGEVIDDANRNEDKYAKRSSRTLDCYGYDDEMSSQFHKELAIMFDDPFERAEEERDYLIEKCSLAEILWITRNVTYDMVAYWSADNKGWHRRLLRVQPYLSGIRPPFVRPA